MALVPRTTFHWLLDNSIGFDRFVMALLNERLGMLNPHLSTPAFVRS